MASRSPLKLTTDPTPRGPLKVTFGVRVLEAIKAPAKGRLWVYDDPSKPRGVSGLAMLTTATGSKSLYHVRTAKGQKSRFLIGKLGEVSIEQARQIAERCNADYADGKNPADARKKVDAAMTVAALIERWLEHARAHKRTAAEDERRAEKWLKGWRSRRVADLTRDDVVKLHRKIGSEAPYEANRVLMLVKAMLSAAVRDGVTGSNVANEIKLFPEQRRERYLDASEMPRFLAALNADLSETYRDALLMLLLTAQRRESVLSMRWADVDLQRAVWTIQRTKAGNIHEVPLTDHVAAILARRRAAAEPEAVYVLPATSATGHAADPIPALKRVCKAAKIGGRFTPHDLRRTWATWAGETGVDTAIIKRALDHSDKGDITAIYRKITTEAMRAAFNATADAMLGTTTTTEGGNQ
jgi:integrase